MRTLDKIVALSAALTAVAAGAKTDDRLERWENLLTRFEAVSHALVYGGGPHTRDRLIKDYSSLQKEVASALMRAYPIRPKDHSDAYSRRVFQKSMRSHMEIYESDQPQGLADQLRVALLRYHILNLRGASAKERQDAREQILSKVYIRYGRGELAVKTLTDVVNSHPPGREQLLLINAGCGLGSDLFVQAETLSRLVVYPYKLIGIELNDEYAQLASQASLALELNHVVEIHVADLTDAQQMRSVMAGRLADGAYANLTLLHVPSNLKRLAWENIASSLKAGAYFRNEDYHATRDTDLDFAFHRISAHPITPSRISEIATSAGFEMVDWQDRTQEWQVYVRNRYTENHRAAVQDQAALSCQNRQFFADVDTYFAKLGGAGHVALWRRV